MANWIGKATAKMEKKGTVGAFGKATPSKIAHAKSEGGIEKKRAVFAENMRHISEHRREYYKGCNAADEREKAMNGEKSEY